jgi:hypothetical protein
MRISSKGRLAFGILAIAAAAAGVLWWAMHQGQLPTPPVAVTQPSAIGSNHTANGSAANGTNGDLANNGNTPDQPMADDVNDPQETQPTPTWEENLDNILLGDDNENGKADKILALMPYTPPEHQEELAQHLVNMVMDEHYEGTSNLLMNTTTSTNVSEVLMNDLLNRNNTLKLNTLLKVMETPEHPMAANAKEMLELFVQEDHGTNFVEWEQAVANWLKENESPAEAQAQTTPADAPTTQ